MRKDVTKWTLKEVTEWLRRPLASMLAIMLCTPSMASAGWSSCKAPKSPEPSLDLYVLRFEKERMTLRVPVSKADSVGMRKLSSDKTMKDALETLKGKPKVKRTMWSRRAQEYEAKINSGDLTSIAEVTRDLFRADDQPEQSYSERQIFEAASSRLARELAAMEQTDEKAALVKILEILNKPRRRSTTRPRSRSGCKPLRLACSKQNDGRLPRGAPFSFALALAHPPWCIRYDNTPTGGRS